ARRALCADDDVDQAGCWRQVVVPQLVMDGLEIPLQFSRGRVHCDQRVSEEIVAGPISAVEIRSWPAHRQIENATFFINSQREGPHVVSGALPCAGLDRFGFEPGFGPRLFAAGQCVKSPKLFAGARIIAMRVADLSGRLLELWADVALAGSVEIRAEEDEVFVDGRRAGIRDLERDFAFLAEAWVDAAGARVERH